MSGGPSGISPARLMLLVAALPLAACREAEPSSQHATATIWPEIQALQREDAAVVVRIRLRDGPTDAAHHLFLDGGDTLLVSLGKPPHDYLAFESDLFGRVQDLTENVKRLVQRDLLDDHVLFVELLLGVPEYETVLGPVSGGAAPRVYVELDRVSGAFTGPSWVELPPGFEVSAPASLAALSRAGPLAIAWSSPDPAATMEADLAVDCGAGRQFSQHLALGADTGSASVASGDYFPYGGVPASATCSAALLLQRVRNGTVSADFAGGSFRGVQQRVVRFTLTP